MSPGWDLTAWSEPNCLAARTWWDDSGGSSMCHDDFLISYDLIWFVWWSLWLMIYMIFIMTYDCLKIICLFHLHTHTRNIHTHSYVWIARLNAFVPLSFAAVPALSSWLRLVQRSQLSHIQWLHAFGFELYESCRACKPRNRRLVMIPLINMMASLSTTDVDPKLMVSADFRRFQFQTSFWDDWEQSSWRMLQNTNFMLLLGARYKEVALPIEPPLAICNYFYSWALWITIEHYRPWTTMINPD